ncbi:MAG TPA: hypothetical protein VM553_07270 [Dongiaceae bacterium]|nr:hypothetical protein [Dongiaceae bacterium]
MNTLKLTALLSAPLMFASFYAFGEQAVGGDETNINRVVTSAAAWTVLSREPIHLDMFSYCISTGSADSQNPNNGVDNNYRFVLSLNNPNPPLDGPCERQVEHDANTQRTEEVSSTCTFRGPNAQGIPPGNHVFYWLARKIGAATPNMTVTDNSFTFVCQHDLLDLDGPADGD